jgi:hypothetical protein
MGYNKKKNFPVNGSLSKAMNIKKIINSNPKLISEDTFFDNKKIYFGTFNWEKMPTLLKSECIPDVVDSLKNEYTIRPQNINTVKCIVLPKRYPKIKYIIANSTNGIIILHIIPRKVLLYFALKSRLTNSANKKRYCFILSIKIIIPPPRPL